MIHDKIVESWGMLWRLHRHLCESARTPEGDKANARISFSQVRLICILFDRREQPMMLKELAEALHLTPGAVSQAVDVLARDGMVERRPRKDDRRSVEIVLSARGQEKLQAAADCIVRSLGRCFEGIPEEDQQVFFQVLSRLWENARKEEQQGGRKEEQQGGGKYRTVTDVSK